MKSKSIKNKDVQLLASIAAGLQPDYMGRDAAWDGSPFAWIKTRPSRQIGKIGEQLIAGWCAAKGLNVSRSTSSDADKVIESLRVEIKFSTLWQGGFYKFQQVRDQKYDVLVCLGVSPFDAHVWVMKKKDIPFKKLEHQHGGSRGTDTWWIQVDPNHIPAWLRTQTGKLKSLTEFFKKNSLE